MGEPEAAVQLSYTEWRVVELCGVPIEVAEGERAITLALDLEESHVSGSGGVNRLMGAFSLAEGELRFGPLATTMMAAPAEAMKRERVFLDARTSDRVPAGRRYARPPRRGRDRGAPRMLNAAAALLWLGNRRAL